MNEGVGPEAESAPIGRVSWEPERKKSVMQIRDYDNIIGQQLFKRCFKLFLTETSYYQEFHGHFLLSILYINNIIIINGVFYNQ